MKLDDEESGMTQDGLRKAVVYAWHLLGTTFLSDILSRRIA